MPPDPIASLRSSSVFAHLDERALQDLSDCLEPVRIRAGEIVIEEGAPPGEAYIVVSGQLDVWTEGEDGTQLRVATLSSGSLFGEMSLMSGMPRSASVSAVRDSRLLKLNESDFDRVVLGDSRALLATARALAARLDESIHGGVSTQRRSVVTLLPVGATEIHRKLVEFLVSDRATRGRTAIVDRAAVGTQSDPVDIGAVLERIEDTHDAAFLLADPEPSDWTKACLRQADLVMIVGAADDLRTVGAGEALIHTSSRSPAETHLVLGQNRGRPVGTAPMLAVRPVDRHHHIRPGSLDDMRRIGRMIDRRTVGLVMGGGGARGFAHIGVLRALMEANVPIDHVGGTSFGASVATGVAMGWDWRTILDWERKATIEHGNVIDLTMPAVALGRGQRLTDGLKAATGETPIEDLWIDFFCVSTDLSRGTAYVHTTGPAWQAMRASAAIPGLFPPIPTGDGCLLVDGGVLNNLPTDVMAERFRPGILLAVDLAGSVTFDTRDLPLDGVVGGWRHLVDRLAPWRETPRSPGIVEVLSRSIMSTSRSDLADYVFRPDVERYGVLDFGAHEALVEAGYRHTAEVLERSDLLVRLKDDLTTEQRPGEHGHSRAMFEGAGS